MKKIKQDPIVTCEVERNGNSFVLRSEIKINEKEIELIGDELSVDSISKLFHDRMLQMEENLLQEFIKVLKE